MAVQVYQAAAIAVWNDEAVWIDEAARTGCRPLAWPRPHEGTHYNRLLSMLFNADVDVVLLLLKANELPHSPDWPPRVDDPKMQTVLRVVQRSLEAGDRALRSLFGGERVTGRREYLNRVHEALAEEAIRMARALGMNRDEAFGTVGLPRRKGFRARRRSVERR
jgi:hypothetical protein